MAACEYIINATFGIGLGAWGAADGSLLEIKPLSPRLPGTSEATLYFGGSCFWVGGLLVLWGRSLGGVGSHWVPGCNAAEEGVSRVQGSRVLRGRLRWFWDLLC